MDLKIGAAYIRVSTDDQTEYSPESQIEKIREFAKRENYVIPEEYIFRDDGISGKTAMKRPAFRLMIATAKETPPPFDRIYVWKYSRFARNQEESLVYKNMLRKNGVGVVSATEPSDDSPYSTLIERIIEWKDEYYLINLAQEVRRGMTEKAQRGEAMGTAPFGYRVENKTFVPDENAETVRYLFEQFAAGKMMRALATELGAKGIRTRRGNVPDNRWIKYILMNPAYIGKIRWSTEGHANYSRANYDDKNVLLVDGKHEPLISSDLWDAVQNKLADAESEPKYVRRDKPRIYMLKGLLRCDACGSTLTYISTKTPTLQCCKYSRGQCRISHSISVEKADAAVLSYLESVAKGKEYKFAPQAPKKDVKRTDWDKLINAENARLKRARDAFLDGTFSGDEYKKIKAEIEDTITRLKEGHKAEEQENAAPPRDENAFRKKLLDVLAILQNPAESPEAKNQALRSVVKEIIFRKPSNTLDVIFF